MPPSRFILIVASALGAGALTVWAGALVSGSPASLSMIVPLLLAASVLVWAIRGGRGR